MAVAAVRKVLRAAARSVRVWLGIGGAGTPDSASTGIASRASFRAWRLLPARWRAFSISSRACRSASWASTCASWFSTASARAARDGDAGIVMLLGSPGRAGQRGP